MGLDEILHHLYILRSDVGERFVENAEFRFGVKYHIHFSYTGLSPGQLTGCHSLICMELIVKCDKAVIIHAIKFICITEGHIARKEYVLRKVFDSFTDMAVICFRLIIETDEDVLRLYAAHNTLEQAGLSASVPAEHTRHPAGLSGDKGALKNLQFVKFEMYAVYQQSVNGLHYLNMLSGL